MVTRSICRFDLNGLHDPVEWDPCPRTPTLHDRSRRALEQEQGQSVGRHQDAADAPRGVSVGCGALRDARDPGERVPRLVLGEAGPVTLDHIRWRGGLLTVSSHRGLGMRVGDTLAHAADALCLVTKGAPSPRRRK